MHTDPSGVIKCGTSVLEFEPRGQGEGSGASVVTGYKAAQIGVVIEIGAR